MSNILKKIKDGFDQRWYEFWNPKEVREKVKKHIDSKGRVQLNRDEETGYICAGARVVCSGSSASAADGNVIVFNPKYSKAYFNGKRIMGTTADIEGDNFVE